MKQRHLGNSGLVVLEIGLGTMTFGRMADEATSLSCLDKAVDAGKVRDVGCSNESARGVIKSLWMAERHGTARYETIQNRFSGLNRRCEDELARVCRDEAFCLLAYSPIAAVEALSSEFRSPLG